MTHRVGILTGGGDAPGLNAVIRAFVRRGVLERGYEVVGVEDSFDGLLTSPRRLRRLDRDDVRGLHHLGGTILGTTNRGDPFAYETHPPLAGSTLQVANDGTYDVSELVARAVAEEGLEGLVVIGGDGTQKIALRLMQERGVKVIGVPKTIDNDLEGTDQTFGFQSAVNVATEALDRLHTTAEAHRRVMVLEVMGRDTGHIAISAGLSGAADVILVPEIPYDPERVASRIQRRHGRGRLYTIIVVAEGALPLGPGGQPHPKSFHRRLLREGRGAAQILLDSLADKVGAEMRAVVLGHLQRGGTTAPSDRLLATRYGAHAVSLVEEGAWGRMVSLRHGKVTSVPLEEAAKTRYLSPDDALIQLARQLDVELGG